MKRALLAITLCTALTACGSSAVTVAPSPKARLAAIVKGVRAQRSVHYATRSSFGYTITADVARGRGIKLFTLRYGTRTSHLTVVLVGGVAYIRGDKGGLGTLGLFRPGTAARYAGRWISIPSSDRGYSAASAGASLESVIRDITPAIPGRVTSRATTIQPWQSQSLSGTKVLVVGMAAKTHAQLVEVRPSGGLPIAAGWVAGSDQGWTLLSSWNKPVHVKAPAHAIAISKIQP